MQRKKSSIITMDKQMKAKHNISEEGGRGKRSRGTNYYPDEMALLLSLVTEFKDIIENKKTDHVVWQEKNEVWKKIEAMFNARSPCGIFRSVESLRKHYENKKASVKKDLADEKIAILKTGGGSYTRKQDPLRDITLSIVNEKTVNGLKNTYDCDSEIYWKNKEKLETVVRSQEDGNIENQEVITLICEEDENVNKEVEHDETPSLYEEREKDIAMGQTEDIHMSWKTYTPEHLKRPISKELQKEIEKSTKILRKDISDKTKSNKEDTPVMDTSWVKRRRPVAGILHGLQSSHLAKKYEHLADLKTQIAEIQLAILKNEMETKEREDHLKMQVLQVELEIKQKQLAIMNKEI